MNGIAVFCLEVAASLTVSAIVVTRLQGMLRRIGEEICPRGADTAAFWVMYLQLMMFIAPLILLAFFSRAGSVPELSAVAQLKSSLVIVLFGQFIGLVILGRTVLKSIPRQAVQVTPPAATVSPVPAGA